MNITEYAIYFKDRLKPEVVFAGEYLETRGLRFGIDFGSTNALQKATDMMLEEMNWKSDEYGELS